MAALSSPQPLAEGENHSYASKLLQKQAAVSISKLNLCPVIVEHGEPTINFTIDEVNEFSREEGLHQAVVIKFSYGKPEIQQMRRNFQSQFEIQGRCNIGQLDFRHLLIRFDLYEDYVKCMSRSTGVFKANGEDYFFRTFPWTLGFNPKEETSMAVVWISLPGLPPNFFAKRSVMSIASAVGKPLAVDKATQDRSRPSTARVKVLVDLLDEHPNKVRLRVVDKQTNKSLVFYQAVVYDNLTKYCFCCKHQGHDEDSCRFLIEKTGHKDTSSTGNNGNTEEQLKGDAREYLNAKRAGQCTVETPTNEAGDGQQHISKLHSTAPKVAEITDEGTGKKSGDRTNAAGVKTDRNDATDAKTEVPKQKVLDTINKGDDKSKKEEVWNVVKNRKSNAKKNASTSQCSPGDQQNVRSNLNSSNAFEAFELDEARHMEITTQKDNSMSKVMVPIANMENLMQGRHLESKERGVRSNEAMADLDKEMSGNSCNIPRLFFSSPQVENIINEAQAAMMKNTNLVRQPLVTLNTSDIEIPSMSEHSFGKYEMGSKQLIMATSMDSDDQGSYEHNCFAKNKTWEDQMEHEEDEDWEDDDEKDYTELDSDDDELRSIVSPPTPSTQQKKLNMNAAAFIPRDQQQINITRTIVQTVAPQLVHKPVDDQSHQNFLTNSQASTAAGQIQMISRTSSPVSNRAEQQKQEDQAKTAYLNHQQQLRTGANYGNQQQLQIVHQHHQKCQSTGQQFKREADQQHNLAIGQQQQVNARTGQHLKPETGKQQQRAVSIDATPVSHMQQQRLVNGQSVITGNHQQKHKCETKEKYADLSPEQQQQLFRASSSNSSGDVNSPVIFKKVKHAEPNYLFDALYEQYTDATLLAISPDDQQEHQPTNNLVCVKLEKNCKDEAARRGDFSHMHSRKGKNRHSRKISWDGKSNDETNVRQIPKKLAKQKKVTPTISTRSTRSQKKR